jgi:hypothetical protein
MPRGYRDEDNHDDKVCLGSGTCIRETAKAILVQLDSDPEDEFWIPQSQVHEDSEVYAKGHDGDIVVSGWWATKNGRR